MTIGEPVELIETGERGRICRDMGFKEYCVQFGTGCLRVPEILLRHSSEPAPTCTPGCLSGC